MKKTNLTLSLAIIGALSACSSAPPPPPPPVPQFTTTMAREYVKTEKQDVAVYTGNQIERINVEYAPSISTDTTLDQRWLGKNNISNFLKDRLENEGIYSTKSATGLTLNVYVTDARIRPDFAAKSLTNLSGADYLEAVVTVVNKNNEVVAKAEMTTPHESACPVNPYKNNKPMCGYKARALQVKSYLMNEISDFVQGAFKIPLNKYDQE